jgi:very-short-patch-repair endonuclease
MQVDLLNATKKIAVEVQGAQHSSFNAFFHNNSRAKYLASIKRDYMKAQWLEKNGFNLIEIEEHEVPQLSEEFIVKNSIKLI